MSDIAEQLEAIQKEIRETPYHKATEHHIGKLRARLARLKDKQMEASAKGGGGGGGYAVKQQGDATVVLVGPPSAGKSTLLNYLTNAQSKVAPYAFTTVTVIPGMMVYNTARIQILDVPGLIEGAEEGKGRGREVLSVIRASDLLVIMTDITRPQAITRIVDALERNGIRVNKKPPHVKIDKKLAGGIIIHSNLKQDLSKETIKDMVNEFGIKNAEITLKEKVSFDTLVDALSRNRVYISAIFVVNKSDLLNRHPIDLPEKSLKISADTGQGVDTLKAAMWQTLEFKRVYLIREDEKPHFDNPLIVKGSADLEYVKSLLGTDFALTKTKAKIWGKGSKFPGQEVSLKTQIAEGMQIMFL